MKAVRVRMPKITTKRSKLFMLAGLFVLGSALSTLSLLAQPQYASAITDAQKDFCVSTYGKSGTVISTATLPENAGWADNKCDDICDTGPGAVLGHIVSTGCDRDKVASEVTTSAAPDAATVNILKKGYGDAAVKALCGSDQACASKAKTSTEQCVDSYIKNGYDDPNAPVFPEVNTDSLAGCMSGKGFSAAQVAKLKTAWAAAKDDITKDAQNANDAASKEACEKQPGKTWDPDTRQCNDPPQKETTCAVEGIGWLICPAMNLMAKLNDTAYTFLASHFLVVEAGLVDGAKDAWAKFRDVANVMFVIAFLAVVYSQITSVGISNYGIKKMLPKIIVAAILVNMSFIICQIAIDISNILGYGIASFFTNITLGDAATGVTPDRSVLGNTLTWAAAIGGILAVGVGIALGVSFPVLLAALLAIGLIVLILIARQALIVLLIVIAPVAFAAYLLPNTEQWFKKWTKMFSSLLLLFPIIALVFGASRLAGIIIYNSKPGDILMQIVALGVSALPFFVVPGLLKGALSAAGAVGAKLQGLANKAGKRVGGEVKDTTTLGAMGKQYKRNQSIKRAQVLGGQAGNRFTKRYHGYINRHTGGYGDKISAQGAATAQKLKTEDVDNEVARMGAASKGPHLELDEATEAYRAALNDGDTVKARAAQKILLSKGNAGVGRIEEVIAGGGAKLNSKNQEAVAYAKSDLAAAGLKGKNAALNQWSYDPKQRSFDEVADDADTYNGLSDAELAAQSDGTLRRAITATAKDKDGNVIAGTTGLSKERAERVLDNKDLQGSLNEKKYDVLHTVSGRPRSAPAAG